MEGYIHQLESFGCADGPGSRFIIFFAGCPLRCLYCHNPDTWKMTDGKLYTVDELVKEAMSCKEYWGKKGGVTVSGGDPLAQIDFLIELFTAFKKLGVNTCIDTSGAPFTSEGEFTSCIRAVLDDPILSFIPLRMVSGSLTIVSLFPKTFVGVPE